MSPKGDFWESTFQALEDLEERVKRLQQALVRRESMCSPNQPRPPEPPPSRQPSPMTKTRHSGFGDELRRKAESATPIPIHSPGSIPTFTGQCSQKEDQRGNPSTRKISGNQPKDQKGKAKETPTSPPKEVMLEAVENQWNRQ